MGELELRIQLVKVKVLSCSVLSEFVTQWTVPTSQEYWSGLPFSSPRDLPNPEIKPGSPTLQILYRLSHQEDQLSCTQIPELKNL